MRRSYLLLSVAVVFIAATFSIVKTSFSSDIYKACDRDAMSATVHATSKQISEMKQLYGDALKRELNLLKKRRGWTDQEFFKKAKVLVQNDKISAYDRESSEILNSIGSMGGYVQNVKADCKMLSELQLRLQKVIATTKAKWEFMLQEIKSTTIQ